MYLSKIVTKENDIACRAFSLLVDDVESLYIAKECRYLEGRYSLGYTSRLLAGEPDEGRLYTCMYEMKSSISEEHQILQAKNVQQYYEYLRKIADTVR